ncbi:MAG: sulfotransferase, partial [Candidatus Thermoplasmatota archaeon]|nr:sulfotransferase [Candidatus Thermoplasmatota archaeon]MBU1941420.1 sulfotransferase [Candidatus Thermoplasmatota archaeon]
MHQSDAEYLHLLDSVSFRPIFIMGLHRSGTSILYKILETTKCFNILTAYHIINYDNLLNNFIQNREEEEKQVLSAILNEHAGSDRGIDRLSLTADFGEEYGFVLGQTSSDMYISHKNIENFNILCKKLQYLAQNEKSLLLKNPYDFDNFMFIKKKFPLAKFVFIHRHPINTMSSLIKAVRMLLLHKNWYTMQLWRVYTVIFGNPLLIKSLQLLFTRFSPFATLYLTLNMHRATQYYLKHIDQLPQNDFITISYEQLCAKPNKTINKIIGFLGCTPKKTINYAQMIQPREQRIDQSIRAMSGFIYRINRQYFERFGYTLH